MNTENTEPRNRPQPGINLGAIILVAGIAATVAYGYGKHAGRESVADQLATVQRQQADLNRDREDYEAHHADSQINGQTDLARQVGAATLNPDPKVIANPKDAPGIEVKILHDSRSTTVETQGQVCRVRMDRDTGNPWRVSSMDCRVTYVDK